MNRRKFLKLSATGAVVISAGNVLQSFAGKDLPPGNKIKCRFAIASDGHYGQPGTDYEAMHDEMLTWLNAEKRGRGVDFTVINGDLFHDDPSMLPVIKKKYDMLTMPYYVSHGNHDQINEAGWNGAWGMNWHYSFVRDDAAFIVLNTADDAGKYICPDLAFAKAELLKYADHKQLFVFMHITPIDWTKHAIKCPELIEMFDKQANLKAIFHGHDHDQDNVKENNGKHYFFDAHIAGNWGTDYRGYRIVEIMKSGDILTYQMNPASQTKVNSNSI